MRDIYTEATALNEEITYPRGDFNIDKKKDSQMQRISSGISSPPTGYILLPGCVRV